MFPKRPLPAGAPKAWRRRTHAIVKHIDASSGRDHLLRVAEGQRQHRAHGRVQSAKAGEQAAAKTTVAMHARSHRRMCQLEQNGPTRR